MANQLTGDVLAAVAQEFGTPLYVYHAEKIKQQYQKLQTAFAGTNTRFFYACKALTNINVLRYMREIGCNVDCSSLNEALLAIQAGFSKENILYTSNNIAFSEIEAAQQLGIHINIDSLSNLEKFGKRFGHTYPVGIRLRPNIMAGGNLKISTGHADSKFGIPLEQVSNVVTIMKNTNLRISNLHIHTGSEIKDVEVFAKGIEVLFEVANQFPELESIDLGGGFKIAYRGGDTVTDIGELAKKTAEEFDRFEKQYGKKVQVWFEPGKFLVSEAGYFIAKVNVLKDAGQTVFAGVDSGLNHFIRPMFYGAYHEIRNISNPDGEKRRYNVVGNICETDTFAENREINEIREGDLLAFENAGAYGFEMSSNYNSRFRPAEVLIKNGKASLIRKRETFEDVTRNQLIID